MQREDTPLIAQSAKGKKDVQVGGKDVLGVQLEGDVEGTMGDHWNITGDIVASITIIAGGSLALISLPYYVSSFPEDHSPANFILIISSILLLLVGLFGWLLVFLLQKCFWKTQFSQYSPTQFALMSHWKSAFVVGVFYSIGSVLVIYNTSPIRVSPFSLSLLLALIPLIQFLTQLLTRKKGMGQPAGPLKLLHFIEKCGIVLVPVGLLCAVGIIVIIFWEDFFVDDIFKSQLFSKLMVLLGIAFFVWGFEVKNLELGETGGDFQVFIWIEFFRIVGCLLLFWVDYVPTIGYQDYSGKISQVVQVISECWQCLLGDPASCHFTYVYAILFQLGIWIFVLGHYYAQSNPKNYRISFFSIILISAIGCSYWLIKGPFSNDMFWKNGLSIGLNLLGNTFLLFYLFKEDMSRVTASLSKKYTYRNKSPFERASIISKYFYFWVTPILDLGYSRPLQQEDIYVLPKMFEPEKCGQEIENAWLEEKQRNPLNPSLEKAVLKVYWKKFIPSAINLVFSSAFQIFARSFLLRNLLLHFEDPNANEALGWIYGISLGVCIFGAAITRQFSWWETLRIGCIGKSAFLTVYYKKALKLGKLTGTTGETINLASIDAGRFYAALIYGNYIWYGVFNFVVVAIFLILEMGWPSVIGVAILTAIPFLALKTGQFLAEFRRRTLLITDKRVRLLNDIIGSIKLVKMYCWEESFSKSVFDLREQEKNLLKYSAYIGSLVFCLPLLIPNIAVFIAIAVYAATGNRMDSTTIWPAMNLFNAAILGFGPLPDAANYISAGRVSLSRLQSLLERPEVSITEKPKVKKPEIHLQDASFLIGTNTKATKETEIDMDDTNDVKMVKMEEEIVLSNVSLHAQSGMLVGIVGRIGSGKSSLLNGILGELTLQSGTMEIQGSIAFAAQQPWLLNDTLQENITFGKPFKQELYQEVLNICQLERDLELLPAGDQTEIGENGINLSGGQKARVSLARAVYSNANIYLLDDPLSAVDQHVGRRLFDDCINGHLRDKLVLFVTNQLQYLSQCDLVILLKDNKMIAAGDYRNLLQNGIFAEMMQNFGENTEQGEQSAAKVEQAQDDQKDKQEGKLTEKEDRSSGKVPLSVYTDYLQGGGLFLTFLSISCFILVATLNALTEWFLSYWIGSAQSGAHALEWYIGILAAISVTFCLIFLLRGAVFAHFTLASSTQMHNDVFTSVMRAPMAFFDSTPLGRILNRLSQDQDKADLSLPGVLVNFLHYSCWSIASVATIIATIPWFAAAVVPGLVVFQYLTNYYVSSSREFKRLEAISVSPMIAHISATIVGLSTIRAYGVVQGFKEEMEKKIITNIETLSLLLVSNRWVGLRFDAIGTVGVLMAISICLVVSKDIGSGLTGLVVSFALTLITNLQWAVRTYAETENDMTSYQRLLTYKTTLPQEAPKKGVPLNNWPSGGSIQFHNVMARYKDNLPAVLKSISFSISKGEKIGIVGRTGSGKSTITLVLFRIIEPSMGTIYIDGIDITKIGLDDLRRSLSIIPQDPVLFIGTLRSNLDPFNEHPDEELWEVLKKVHLFKFVKSLPMGLEAEIQEKGNNLSLGQRQLICIARALLRKSQILILDEATASVDYETDHLIQQTIKESFSHCTILTIAHRLHTIVHSDRILVLEGGNVLEFDTPAKLLSDSDSQFSSLVKETDPQTQAFLQNAILNST